MFLKHEIYWKPEWHLPMQYVVSHSFMILENNHFNSVASVREMRLQFDDTACLARQVDQCEINQTIWYQQKQMNSIDKIPPRHKL